MAKLSINNKNIQYHFLSILLVLIAYAFNYLPLLFLPLSPFYFLAIGTIILFVVLFYSTTSLKSLFNYYSVFYWYVIFLSWYSIRMLTQPSTQLMLVNFEQVYLVTPVVIFLCINFRYLQDYVSNVVFFLGGIYAIFGITTYYYLSNTNELNLFSSNIFSFFDLDFDVDIYQNVGFWISLFAICLFNLILKFSRSFKKNRFIMLCLIFSFLISTYMLLIAGARGAFLGLVIALIYLSRNIRDKKFIYSSVSGIVVLVFLSFLNQDSFLTINRLISIFNGYDQSSRIFLFSQAIQLWTHDISTILFGGGVKSFPIFIYQNNFGVYPHNIFLEILSELGLVGLIIFLKILFIFYKNRGNNDLINAFSIFTVFIFCVTGSLDSFYQAFFFLCLGLKKKVNQINLL